MAQARTNLQTLATLGDPLAETRYQRAILEDPLAPLPTFDGMLADHGKALLRATNIDVLQLNLGRLCNQTCAHCHVDAGPDRTEVMSRDTIDECLAVFRRHDIATLDITGGAPELNPDFRYLVRQASKLGRRVIDRSNLTILVAPRFNDLPEFLAEHRVEVVASLPCYLEENCDRQRGHGVFQRSIQALLRLNDVGFGMPGKELSLTLVYNPQGASLPPNQDELETDYRRELAHRYGIQFTHLYTINNMPISRFLDYLRKSSRYEEYMLKLVAAFNPAAVDAVMCRTTLSVDWRGHLYDCDFNQMLGLTIASKLPREIRDFDFMDLATRRIITGRHCLGCTAGAGSSCQGSLM